MTFELVGSGSDRRFTIYGDSEGSNVLAVLGLSGERKYVHELIDGWNAFYIYGNTGWNNVRVSGYGYVDIPLSDILMVGIKIEGKLDGYYCMTVV